MIIGEECDFIWRWKIICQMGKGGVVLCWFMPGENRASSNYMVLGQIHHRREWSFVWFWASPKGNFLFKFCHCNRIIFVLLAEFIISLDPAKSSLLGIAYPRVRWGKEGGLLKLVSFLFQMNFNFNVQSYWSKTPCDMVWQWSCKSSYLIGKSWHRQNVALETLCLSIICCP